MGFLLQDFRHAFRLLRKQPGFTITAVLTLALGIGAATAVFSVAYGVLIDPFPYKDVNTLATPKLCSSHWSRCGWDVYTPDAFNTIVKNTTIFSGVTASTISPVILTGLGDPQQIRGNYITPNTFDVMGVQPFLGRASNDSDVKPGHGEVALLSYRYWQSHFGGSASILGRVVDFNGHPRTIIGVMPPRFLWRGADVYLPIPMEGGESVQGQHNFALVGRVKPGVTEAEASAQLQAVFTELSHKVQHAFPPDLRLGLMPFPEMFKSALGGTLYLLLGAVGVLLLIACVNVCGLLLARAVNREHEFVVRASVGASRQRLVRYALTESLLLAIIAIPVAVAFAYAGLQATLRIVPPDTIPDESVITMNIPVLLTSIGIALVTVFISGLAPAWHSAHPRLTAALNGTRASGSQSQRRILSSFVVTEIALSLALLMTAGLMFRSLLAVEHEPPSFSPDHTLAMQIPLDSARYPTPASQYSFYRQLMEKTRALPGVNDVTIDDAFPFVDMNGINVQLPGQEMDKRFVALHLTGPSYPSMAQLQVVAGHFLDDREIEAGAHEVVVTANFAQRYFEGRNALNQVVHLPELKSLPKDGLKDDAFVIVGVIANLPSYLGFSRETPQIYLPYTVVPAANTLIVSTSVNADSMLQTVRQAVYSIDKDQPVSQASSLRQMLEMYGYAGPRFALALFGTFAGAALLLSFVGIYGVLSFVTAQRTKEIGIRMALGANRASVMWMVLRHAGVLALIGVAAGVPLAFAAGRFAREAELLRTSQYDPLVLLSAMSLLPLLALAGTWLPARRAAAIDPIHALRTE
ncbi:ABC transporter permease [Silvibacterium acidisoli]|uniref:ABC transporter permease n=1 Tax=Acidobacteriaceae bacterium ZG23-2 TaxID=2883246 RepID=UPI00406C47D6